MSSEFLDSDFPTFRRMWRSIKTAIRAVFNRRVALRLLAIIAVLFVVHAMLMVVWGRQLEARFAQLRARGEPLNGIDLARRVPDSENGAVVYEKVFAALKAAGVPLWSSGLLDVTTTAKDRAALEPEARKAIAARASVFPLIEEGARKPKCVFPVRWQDGADALFPHTSGLRETCRVVSLKAIIDARDGKVDAALKDVTLGLKVSRALEKEPGLISYLTRISCTKMITGGLREATRSRSLSISQARRMYDEVGDISLAEGFVLAMQGERTFINWCFDTIRTGSFLRASAGSFKKVSYTIRRYLWRPISYKDQMVAMDVIDRQMRRAKLPYRQALTPIRSSENGGLNWFDVTADRILFWAFLPDIPPSYESCDNALCVPRYAMLTRFLASAHYSTLQGRDSAMAELGLGQVAMALKAYKSEFGAYPASLKDLKTKLSWRLPDDPFTGKPFVYKRAGHGFLLYSWGPDLKDDHGKQREAPGDGDQTWVSEI
ncbi:MAG: hypothetical protein Q7T82_08525 [Armatimonadota bacterium]|nr:hypothetical protein [Armatimonadota bacterium]